MGNANDAILVAEAESIDAPGPRIVYANESFTRMTGYTAGEVIGQTPRLLQGEKTDRAQLDEIRRALGNWEPVRVEVINYRKDGSEFWVELNIAPVTGENGRVTHWVSIQRQTTERRLAEEALEESERRFRSVVQNSSEVVKITEADGTLRYASPAFERIFGYTPEEFVGTNVLDYVHPEDLPRVQEESERALQSSGVVSNTVEYRFRHADGSWIWVESIGTYLLDDPAVEGVVLNARDITERKRAEEALEESYELLRAVMEGTTDAVFVKDLQGRYLMINQAGAEVLGKSVEEVVGKGDTELFAEEDGREVMEEDRKILAAGETLTTEETKTPGGQTSTFLVTKGPYRDGDGNVAGMFGVAREITERKRAEEALRRSEGSLAAAQRMAHVGNWEQVAGRVLYWSDELYRIYGFTPKQFVPTYEDVVRAIHPDDREYIEKIQEEVSGSGNRTTIECRIVRPDGEVRIVQNSFETDYDETGELTRIAGTVQDITERKETEEALEKQRKLLREVIDTNPNLIFVKDFNGHFTLANQAAADIYDTTVEGLLGSSDADFNANEGEIASFLQAEREVMETFERKLIPEERVTDSRTGRVRWFQTVKVPLEPPESLGGESPGNGGPRLLGVSTDITERKMLEQRLEYQAFHDSLTDLPNRALFTGRLRHALAGIRRREGQVAILFVDLDNFKIINDTLGHTTGDRLLVEVARRLENCLRPADTVARFSGDEFTVLLEDIRSVDEAKRVAERTLEELQSPVSLNGNEIFATACIGIALSSPYPGQALDTTQQPEDLLRQADMAMYKAKHSGKAHYEVFDRSLEAPALERLQLGHDLRRALDRGEFKVYYQPVVGLSNSLQSRPSVPASRAVVAPQRPQDARSSSIIGMEALIRWEHPERGLLLPDEFIPIAEENGLIIPIGQWVLEQACRQAYEWQQQYLHYPPLLMTVNFSAKQLQGSQSAGIVGDLSRVLRETGVDPSGLGLEITENTVIEDEQSAINTLQELKALGVKLIVDDFGTGYSSLSYLKKFPVDILKIDRSFIKELPGDHQNREVVSAVISLAHALNMEVVGEGIESEGQCTQSRDLGCEMGQGYYFSEPLSARAADALLAKDPHW